MYFNICFIYILKHLLNSFLFHLIPYRFSSYRKTEQLLYTLFFVFTYNSFLQVSHYTLYIIGFLYLLPVFFRFTLALPRKLRLKNPTLYVKIQPQSNPLKNVKTLGMTGFLSLGSENLTLFGKKKFFKFKKWRFLFFWKSFLKRVRFWKKIVKTLDMTGF